MRTKSESRRQAIIDAATKVFHEAGYELASMSEIAVQVGGSKATLYNYFPSKSALFSAVILSQAEREFGALQAKLQCQNAPDQVLYDYGVQYLDRILAPYFISLRRMVQSEADQTDAGRLVYENGFKIGWMAVSEYLKSAMNSNLLHVPDPWVAAMHLRALYEAELVEYFLFGIPELVAQIDRADVIRRAVDVFMAAYGPKRSLETI